MTTNVHASALRILAHTPEQIRVLLETTMTDALAILAQAREIVALHGGAA